MTTLRCPLNEAADISPQEAALIRGDTKLTFAELEWLVTGAAARLRKAGCGEGERVALCLKDDLSLAVLTLALLRLRAVACPLDPGPPAKAWMEALDIRHAVAGPGASWTPEELIPSYYEGQDSPDRAMLALEQPAAITIRGCDGKALLHTVGSLYYGARGANHAVRLSSGSRWLLTEPLFAAEGLALLFRCLIGGAALVLDAANEPRAFALRRHRVTHAVLSAGELAGVLETVGSDGEMGSLRAVLVQDGGSAPDTMRRAREAGLPVCPSYGLAEVASGVALAPPTAAPAQRATSGPALKYRDVRVGGDGHILVRGPALFGGYIEGHAVRRPLDAEGWFDTGDRGRMEEDGCLRVIRRGPDSARSSNPTGKGSVAS